MTCAYCLRINDEIGEELPTDHDEATCERRESDAERYWEGIYERRAR